MYLRELVDPVDSLKGVGPRNRQLLEQAGIRTVGDLLLYLPRDLPEPSKTTDAAIAVAFLVLLVAPILVARFAWHRTPIEACGVGFRAVGEVVLGVALLRARSAAAFAVTLTIVLVSLGSHLGWLRSCLSGLGGGGLVALIILVKRDRRGSSTPP